MNVTELEGCCFFGDRLTIKDMRPRIGEPSLQLVRQWDKNVPLIPFSGSLICAGICDLVPAILASPNDRRPYDGVVGISEVQTLVAGNKLERGNFDRDKCQTYNRADGSILGSYPRRT